MAYLFIPPTVYERIVSNHPLFGRMRLHRGMTLLKSVGLYRQTRNPSDLEISEADVAYIGGHNYVVSDEEAALLVKAGYSDWLTKIQDGTPVPGDPDPGEEEPPVDPVDGDGGYGSGVYGDGPYGGSTNV